MKSFNFKRLALCHSVRSVWGITLLLLVMLMPQVAWAENLTWSLTGVKYGTCSVNDNTVISFNNLNNSSWGSNTIQTDENLGANGCQGTKFVGCVDENGTQLYVWPHYNHKYISITQYAHSETVPAYAKLNRNSTFKVCMATARYFHGAGLYVFDDLTAASTTNLDAMPQQNETTPTNCILKATDNNGDHSWTQNDCTISFDNSTSATESAITKYIVLTHVNTTGDDYNKKIATDGAQEWAGFIEETYLNTYIYYATITFVANGGSGTMANQTIEGSGTLTANTFTSPSSDKCFVGWNTKADGTGTPYAAGATFNATAENKGPITLYAQWQNHAFNYTYNNDASCTVNGTKTASCDRCGVESTIADADHPATGHSFTNYTYNNDATCTVDGTKTASCDHGCGTTNTIDDAEHPASGHNIPDNFDTNGLKICDRCHSITSCQPAEKNSNKFYEIGNAGQLAWFRDQVNSSTGNNYFNAILTADIDLSPVCHPADEENGIQEVSWKPIAANSAGYKTDVSGPGYMGKFYGEGHKITNLYINNNSNYVGLFGICGSINDPYTDIKDLSIQGNVKGGNNVGLLCGYCFVKKISNCKTLEGSQVSGTYRVGGLIGSTPNTDSTGKGYFTITGFENHATVTGTSYVGGIVGANGSNANTDSNIPNSFDHCINYGSIKATTECAGGLSGTNLRDASYCANVGSVSASKHAGGFSGYANSKENKISININNSYNYGSITCSNNGGAFIGYKCNASCTFNNVFYKESQSVFGATYDGSQTGEPAAKTEADFTSGNVCYLLNNSKSDGSLAWYQKLGENGDTSPVLTSTGSNTVYYGYTDCEATETSYSNTMCHSTPGHGYEVSWSWSEDYSNATCTLTCSHDANHNSEFNTTTEPKVTITSTDTKNATCTVDGERTYSASVTYEGATYTDQKVVSIPAGHNIIAQWSPRIASREEIGCTLYCNKCMTLDESANEPTFKHQFEKYFTEHTDPAIVVTATVSRAASCTQKGAHSYLCSLTYEGKTYPHDYENVEDIDQLSHSFTNYIYNNDETCVAGTKTATCDHGCGATDTQTDSEHPGTGLHTFADDDYSHSECTVCHHGFFRYNTTDNSTVGLYLTTHLYDSKGKVLETISHKYDATDGRCVWEFNKPLYRIGANAFSTCTKFTGTLYIGKNVSLDGSAFDANSGFTAVQIDHKSLMYFGNQGLNTANLTVKVLSNLVAEYKNTENPKNVNWGHVTCIVHSCQAVESNAATCTEAGNTAYYKCTYCDDCFSDENGAHGIDVASTVIPALGHNYDTPSWSWHDDGSNATCILTCSHDANHKLMLDKNTDPAVSITSEITKAADCEKNGEHTYSASVTYEGTSYADSKVIADIAKSHEFADELDKDVCTKCGHGFFRYQSANNCPIYPYQYDDGIRPLLDEDSKPLTILSNEYVEAEGNCVIEFDKPLAIIGDEAFKNCYNLLGTLNIPSSVTSIGAKAFASTEFTGLTIPSSVASIGDEAFQSCLKLSGTLNIPSSVARIGVKAFAYNSLTDVNFVSIPSIGLNAFEGSNSDKHLILSDNSYVYTGNNEGFPTLYSATYTRTMANQWGTIVLPFGVSVNGSETYDFYELSSVTDDGAICLTRVTSLAASTPALIRMSAAAKNSEGKYELSISVGYTNVVVKETLTAKPEGDLTLTGSYDVKEITNQNGYIIANNMFWSIQEVKGDNKVYNAPFRAYLASSSANNAPQLRIGSTEDNETYILEVLNDLNSDESEIFDMNGRRMDDLHEGMNIVKRGNRTIKVIIK